MQALILDGDSTYLSPVFAVKETGWSSEVVAFDFSYSFVKCIPMWIPERRVFIVAWTEFACKKGKWRGYEWLLQDKTLLRDLRRKKPVSATDYPEFKTFSQEAVLPEWLEIKNENDITALEEASLGFHDSTVMRANQTGNDLEITFDTSWGCYVTVRFLDVLEENLVDKIGMILSSKIGLEEDGIRWSITDGYAGWVDGVDFDSSCTGAYIKCKKMLWKIEVLEKRYKRQHANYADIEELYDDLKSMLSDVALKEDTLTVSYQAETLEIKKVKRGYSLVKNGVPDQNICADREIYACVLDFAMRENDPTEGKRILWQTTSSMFGEKLRALKYFGIPSAIWVLIGLVPPLLFSGSWIVFASVFLVPSIVIFAPAVFTAFLRSDTALCLAIDDGIVVQRPYDERFLPFSRIENIKMKRCLFHKNRGTLKFVLKKGSGASVVLDSIDNIDNAYAFLRYLWEKQKEV